MGRAIIEGIRVLVPREMLEGSQAEAPEMASDSEIPTSAEFTGAKHKALVIFTDGEDHEGDPAAAAALELAAAFLALSRSAAASRARAAACRACPTGFVATDTGSGRCEPCTGGRRARGATGADAAAFAAPVFDALQDALDAADEPPADVSAFLLDALEAME
mgnify:CR=1 FL=1